MPPFTETVPPWTLVALMPVMVNTSASASESFASSLARKTEVERFCVVPRESSTATGGALEAEASLATNTSARLVAVSSILPKLALVWKLPVM